jgi:hypothetical protein
LLKVFGIPSPLHGDLRGGVIDRTEIVGCKFDCYRSDVLFEAHEPSKTRPGSILPSRTSGRSPSMYARIGAGPPLTVMLL